MLKKIKDKKWIVVTVATALGAWGVAALVASIGPVGVLGWFGGVIPAVVGAAAARFGSLLVE